MDAINAIVQKLIMDGEHGPYAVATNESLNGSVTFSLEPTVWKEKDYPEPGSVVYLTKIMKKRAGWRAKEGRYWTPSDEQIEQSEMSKIAEGVISFAKSLHTCAISTGTEKIIERMAEPLDLNTILSISKTVINAPTHCGCYNSGGSIERAWRKLIFGKVKTEEDLEKMTSSKEVSFPWEGIFHKAIEIKSKIFIVKAILKISNFEKFDLSVPMQLMNGDERRDILNSIVLSLEKEADSALQKHRDYYEKVKNDPVMSYNNPYIGIYLEVGDSCLESRLKIIKLMLDSGIEFQNSKERLIKIANHIGFLERRPNSNYASARYSTDKIKQSFAEVSLKVLPLEITSKGLEFVNAGNQRIAYLNGNLVGEMGGAQYIQVKGDALAWMTSFEFDRDANSVQYKSCVFAWKKGWKEPKEIYERHAWTREGILSVSFEFDGQTVKITSTINGKDNENREINLSA